VEATSAVVGSVVVIVGTSVIKDVKDGRSPIPPVVSGFMLGSALLLIALAWPQFAKVAAGLGVVGAFVTNGPQVLGTLGGIGPQPPAAPKGPKGAR
jgi:hypothetical protein